MPRSLAGICLLCVPVLLCFIALVECCLFPLQRGERPPARAGEAGQGTDDFASGRPGDLSLWSALPGKCRFGLGCRRLKLVRS